MLSFRLVSVVCSSLVTMVPEVPGGLVALSSGPSLLSLVAIDFGGKLKRKEILTTSSLTKFVCFVFRGVLTCSLMAVYMVILGGGENSASN